MKKTQINRFDHRNQYLAAIFLMTAVFLVAIASVFISIERYYVNQSSKAALIKLETFQKRYQAKRINTEYLYQLLDQQFATILQSILLQEENLSEVSVREIEEIYQLKGLQWFDQTGNLIYGNVEPTVLTYLSEFIDSSDQNQIIELTQTSWLALGKGNQGIIAFEMDMQSLDLMFYHFSATSLINEFQEDEDILMAYFLDEKNEVMAYYRKASETSDWFGSVDVSLLNQKEVRPLANHPSILVSSIPLMDGQKRVGTFLFFEEISFARSMITTMTMIASVTILAIFAILLGLFFNVGSKNKKIMRLHYFDTLTGLPNKEFLYDLLSNPKKSNQVQSQALILIKLAKLSSINMLYGYRVGDEVIKAFVQRLQSTIDENHQLFRYTGHYFVFYLPHVSSQKQVEKFVAELLQLQVLSLPKSYMEVNVGLTLGVYTSDYVIEKADSVFQSLDIAISIAKRNPAMPVAYYDRAMEDHVFFENHLVQEMKLALSDEFQDQFYMVYQPIVSKTSKQVHTYEALLRFHSKEYGLISPEVFIPLAEAHQLIVPLGYKVLNWVMSDMQNKKFEYLYHRVAINLSIIQLLQPDFVSQVLRMISDRGLKTNQFEFEITESVLENSFDLLNVKLKQLHDAGIYLAIDDFGTGFSSLSRIKEMHVDCIKIDRSFITPLIELQERSLVADIIVMAHRLGYEVVAEGVETREQVEKLVDVDCDYLQGYYFDRPKRWSELKKLND